MDDNPQKLGTCLRRTLYYVRGQITGIKNEHVRNSGMQDFLDMPKFNNYSICRIEHLDFALLPFISGIAKTRYMK